MTVVHEIVMPQLGQAMESGVVTAWKLEDGSEVAAGETIAIVESDKASYDIEAAFA
jgi:pyruvate dehydrogenase E2 component (dihydrolipoamide acetyltransferase)